MRGKRGFLAMKMWKPGAGLAALSSVVLAALAGPAVAQDGSESSAARTPENAQRFLNVMSEQYPITITPIAYYHYQHAWYLSYKPARISATDRCTSRIDGEVERFYATDAANQRIGGWSDVDVAKNAQWLAENGEAVARLKIKTVPYEIDWSKVTFLDKTPNYASTYNQATKSYEKLDGWVSVVAGDVSLTFAMPSVELAGRMMLAMETLKKACDKTEGLGF